MRPVNHCVCFASNPAFGHLALCLMCRWGQIAERRLQTRSFKRCRVCEPGLDMCCQRAITPDLSPKTLTLPSPILFTPSNHMPLCPVHWPDGCLIKDGGIYSGQITNIALKYSLIPIKHHYFVCYNAVYPRSYMIFTLTLTKNWKLEFWVLFKNELLHCAEPCI